MGNNVRPVPLSTPLFRKASLTQVTLPPTPYSLSCFTAILTSRFILDLQEVEAHRRTDPQLTTIKFTKVLGSLGAPLPPFGATTIGPSLRDGWDGPSGALDDDDEYSTSPEEADKERYALAEVARPS